jgi:hypothetical protein
MIFKTTPHQQSKVPNYIMRMKRAGVENNLLQRVRNLSLMDQGIFDLLELWIEAENEPAERSLILEDLRKTDQLQSSIKVQARR